MDPKFIRTRAHDIESLEEGKEISLNEDKNVGETFVDYVPPPPKPIPPPAKYKLWLMVILPVYFADYVAGEADAIGWMQRELNISPAGSLFILLTVIVGVLTYGALDVLLFLCRIKVNGKEKGLRTWLKHDRIQWVHEYQNVFVDLVRIVVLCLEDGFAIFNAAQTSSIGQPKQFECKNINHEKNVTLRIENIVRKDKIDEYLAWRTNFFSNGCLNRPGMKSVETLPPREGDNHFVTFITFSSVDYLNEFMASPIRRRFVRNLQPLLEAPSSMQLRKDRMLPDAFTDLCNQQGHQVPTRLPKKWKVWVLTTIGLYLCIEFSSRRLPHYYAAWGLDEAHPRARALASVVINTFLNSYVTTPLMTLLFGHWLVRKDDAGDDREPWRTLNDGFKKIYGKLFVCTLYYGLCATWWMVKRNK